MTYTHVLVHKYGRGEKCVYIFLFLSGNGKGTQREACTRLFAHHASAEDTTL